MARSAAYWFRKKGTEMARAMLKALGIPYGERLPEIGTMVSEERYTEIMDCFENHGTPMDGRILA